MAIPARILTLVPRNSFSNNFEDLFDTPPHGRGNSGAVISNSTRLKLSLHTDTMADSTGSSERQVHLGIWTNWSHGKVLGATITLTQGNGTLLVAFIALFVSYVGTSFWRIMCFVAHQVHSSKLPQDGLYHQRQVILRNSANGTDALWNLSQVLWYWRLRRRSCQRLLPSMVYAGFIVLAFAIAGIFSSQIATLTGNEVLISSRYCGIVSIDSSIPELFYTKWTPYTAQRFASSFTYAQRCYSNSSNQGDCNSFVKTRLPSTTIRNASCPFREDICRTSNGNIKIDTGYLDSHWDLGFNAPESKRVRFRRILHCAPLVMDNYTDSFNYSTEGVETTYRRYYYGSELAQGVTRRNFTYMHPEMSLNQLHFENFSYFADYSIKQTSTYVSNGSILLSESGFRPVSAMERKDADISLVFLSSNNIVFSQQVDDYMYAAHQPAGGVKTHHDNQSASMYVADQPGSVLGCTTQYQTCVPTLPKDKQCGPLGGVADTFPPLPAESDEQFNMTQWMLESSFTRDEPISIFDSIGVTVLPSRYRLYKGIQGPLPDNQWQLDVESWHNVSLAAMQAGAVDTAAGPSDPDLVQYLQPPQDKLGQYFCKNQKILSAAHTNFSIFGLAFIFIIGGLVVLISWTLESILGWVQRTCHLDQYSRLEWCVNSNLQLQRLAHEELEIGTWSNCDGCVPMTECSDRLALLDLDDLKHPKLKLPELLPKRAENTQSENSEKEEPRNRLSSDQYSESREISVDAGFERRSTNQTDNTVVNLVESDEPWNVNKAVPAAQNHNEIDRKSI